MLLIFDPPIVVKFDICEISPSQISTFKFKFLSGNIGSGLPDLENYNAKFGRNLLQKGQILKSEKRP